MRPSPTKAARTGRSNGWKVTGSPSRCGRGPTDRRSWPLVKGHARGPRTGQQDRRLVHGPPGPGDSFLLRGQRRIRLLSRPHRVGCFAEAFEDQVGELLADAHQAVGDLRWV